MANYSVCRLDSLAGTTNPTKLVSFRYHNGTSYAAIENDFLVSLDSLIEGEREIWKAVAPTANQALGKLVLCATPELMYNTVVDKNLSDFQNEAGADCRGYILSSGDIFGVTVDAFASDTAPTSTNKYITIAAAAQSMTADSSATNARLEYIATESDNGYTYYVLRVI